MTFKKLSLTVAVVIFVVAAFIPTLGPIHLVAAGLAFLGASLFE